GQRCVGVYASEGGSSATEDGKFTNNTYAITLYENEALADNNTGSVSVDATNITVTWTKNGTIASQTCYILWEAETKTT
ncbi:hypothetical protein, partial [Streptococcus pneumoniae]|uniref:hypothetical protein n=1 Tax=Streptococcus pneumoniae TaxID=1313 RepID=UPI0018B07E71